MDELVGALLASFAGLLAAVFAIIFLPFVALGQVVYFLLTIRSESRPHMSFGRKSVFRLYRDSVSEVVTVYGVAVCSFALTIWLLLGAPVGNGYLLRQNPTPIAQSQPLTIPLRELVTENFGQKERSR